MIDHMTHADAGGKVGDLHQHLAKCLLENGRCALAARGDFSTDAEEMADYIEEVTEWEVERGDLQFRNVETDRSRAFCRPDGKWAVEVDVALETSVPC